MCHVVLIGLRFIKQSRASNHPLYYQVKLQLKQKKLLEKFSILLPHISTPTMLSSLGSHNYFQPLSKKYFIEIIVKTNFRSQIGSIIGVDFLQGFLNFQLIQGVHWECSGSNWVSLVGLEYLDKQGLGFLGCCTLVRIDYYQALLFSLLLPVI